MVRPGKTGPTPDTSQPGTPGGGLVCARRPPVLTLPALVGLVVLLSGSAGAADGSSGLPPVAPSQSQIVPGIPPKSEAWIAPPPAAVLVQQPPTPQPVPPEPPTAPAPVPPIPVPPEPVLPEPVAPTPVPPTPVPPTPVAPTPVPPAPEEPERPKAEKPREAALLERGAILLPMGTLQVEPSVEYSHFSSDRVAISGFTIFEAIVIGTIRVDKINRDIVTGALAARYGLLNRLQVDARVPYVYRRDSELLGVGTADERERTIQATNLGDVEGSISGQALIGGGALPDVILRVQGKLHTGKDPFRIKTVAVGGGETRLEEPPTGSGFNSVAPGATLVWRSDPVVFFVGGSYTHILSREVGRGFGRIKPGPSIQAVAGLNLAVSERVGVNITFVDQFTLATKQNGIKRIGTSVNDARLVLGTSISLLPNLTLLVSAGAGLTQDSPDFVFSISLPITFKLF